MLSEERLAEIAAADRAATPGPWYAGGPPWGTGGMVYARSDDPHAGTFVADCQMQEMEEEAERIHSENMYADAAFIACARQAVPELLAEVQRLRVLVMRMNGYTQHIEGCYGRKGLRCTCGVEMIDLELAKLGIVPD